MLASRCISCINTASERASHMEAGRDGGREREAGRQGVRESGREREREAVIK